MDVFGVDDLFDFSGDCDDDIFSSSTANATQLIHNFNSPTASGSQFQYISSNNNYTTTTGYQHSADFTDHFCVPSDDVAELEWLSKFVDDSVSNFPANNIAGTINFRPENTQCHSRSRSKRTRTPSNNNSWTSTQLTNTSTSSSSCETTPDASIMRRCTHCASEKTPQWRTGPLGPKTLCNACGVRYKSGRLVPEYRPAASPTFVMTQHSNSHRKVMELRRQKEQEVVSLENQIYRGGHYRLQQQGLHHGSKYEVC